MSDTQEKPAATGRGLKIALFLSLAFNLLIVGLVVGFVAKGGGQSPGDRNPGPRAIGLGPFLPALSPEDRSELGARIRANMQRLAQDGRPFGDAVQGLAAALRTEPFDRVAAEAALAAQRAHGAALQSHGHEMLLDQIETMTVQARSDLADRIENALRRAASRAPGRE